MSAPDICGFVVVRLPKWDVGLHHRPAPIVEEKTYRGIDRLRWEIPEDTGDTARSSMRDLVRQVEKGPFGGTFFDWITPDLLVARQFMRHGKGINEILAVYADELARVGGSFKCVDPLEDLGYELFAAGEWSPHRDGVFLRPEAFPDMLPLLNRHGLFDTEGHTRLLGERYVALSMKEIVEPLANPPMFVTLRIHRVI